MKIKPSELMAALAQFPPGEDVDVDALFAEHCGAAATPAASPADQFVGADKMVETPAVAPSEPVALPFAILADEMAALRRFDECVRDGQGYDVRKLMMKRLSEIGLVRRVTANVYEHTNFGLSVLDGDFAAPPPPARAPEGTTAEQKLAAQGVFKGAHGLRGLAESQMFWDEQPYGTRIHYGIGVADYLHRDVLRAAVAALDAAPTAPGATPPRQGLTDAQIEAIWRDVRPEEHPYTMTKAGFALVRRVEASHGITPTGEA